jgi:hypothetical protein
MTISIARKRDADIWYESEEGTLAPCETGLIIGETVCSLNSHPSPQYKQTLKRYYAEAK